MTATAHCATSAHYAGKVQLTGRGAAALTSGQIASLQDPAAAGWPIIKQNASRTVYRNEIDGTGVYVKHFHPKGRLKRLARKLGCSHARREAMFAQRLEVAGVPTAPVLAWQC